LLKTNSFCICNLKLKFFCGSLVLVSWQAFISSFVMKLDFYKPTVLKVHPPNTARLISTQYLLPCFDPNEWCMKNGLHSGGLNSQPLSHESLALTTRPRLLAKFSQCKFSSINWEKFKSSWILKNKNFVQGKLNFSKARSFLK
jgi:hypothetical protein